MDDDLLTNCEFHRLGIDISVNTGYCIVNVSTHIGGVLKKERKI